MMHRRGVLAGLALGAAATAAPARSAEGPRFAVTIDDFRFEDGPLMTGFARHRAILDALSAARVQAAGLITGKHVANTAGQLHLGTWAEAGHAVGNHTFNHAYHGGSGPPDLGPDIDGCARVLPRTRQLRPWFRFPYLAEGRTAEFRDRMRADLKARGLRNAHVTIDASDWYVDQRLKARLAKEPDADPTPYGDYLVAHLLDRAAFYDRLARDVIGRSPAHTLLIHHNLTTALFLPRVLAAFAEAGWTAIDADDAFADPVFAAQPDIAPCARSLIHQLAKADGRFSDRLRHPGEDGPYEAPAMDALGL